MNRDQTQGRQHAWQDTGPSTVSTTMEDAPKPKSLQLNCFLSIEGSWLDLMIMVVVSASSAVCI